MTELALAARDGDQAALGRFVRSTQPDVWRLVAHLLDRNEADDITQEVYERALRGLAGFRGVVRPDLVVVDRPADLCRRDPAQDADPGARRAAPGAGR